MREYRNHRYLSFSLYKSINWPLKEYKLPFKKVKTERKKD